MKIKAIVILMLLVLYIASTGLILVAAQDKDNFGKVIGQIVDPETGQPVNEVFRVKLLDPQFQKFPFKVLLVIESDEHGRFEMDLPPDTFYLLFYPISNKSKYCFSLPPFKLKMEDRDILIIEQGKITYFQKKAPLGGILKIYMADANNTKIVPNEIFTQKFFIESTITGADYLPSSNEHTLDMGEDSHTRLPPGIYQLSVNISGIGFESVYLNNINISKKKTTEIIIKIDINDNTGIEGIISDAAGQPMTDLEIDFSSGKFRYMAYPSQNGYYKLTGMWPGEYSMSLSYITNRGEKNFGVKSVDYEGKIKIEKNILLHFDYRFDKLKAELENN